MLASNNTWSFSGAVNQQTGRRCAELRRVLVGERATTGLHCVYRHLEHTQAERSASLCKGRVQTPQRGFFCCAYPACRCFCTSATAPPPVAAAPLASVGVSQPSCSLSAAACSTSSPSLPPTCSAVVVFAPPFGGISGRTNSGASQDMVHLFGMIIRDREKIIFVVLFPMGSFVPGSHPCPCWLEPNPSLLRRCWTQLP